MTSEDVVLLNTTREGVAVVTLNRPEVHNAFNPDVIERLLDIFETLRGADGVRVVLLEGNGPSFSAGADLNWMRAAAEYDKATNEAEAKVLGQMLNSLFTLPKPTIAVVHGPALAGGMGLVSACDMAIASENVFFALTEVRIGLSPSTISPYVVRAMGPRMAHRYFLTGERFTAAEAYRMGYLHAVVKDRNALAQETEKMVETLFMTAPDAVRRTKELIGQVTHADIDKNLIAYTANHIAEIRQTDEGREGTGAFLQKRKPWWQI
ncbi:MAG: enoyl-CoA hydratase/isomerase family protein [Pseudomonadota bacterium]